MKNIDFMLTAFRDGFQSVYGARVFTDDFIPAVEAARDAGIRYFEAGGGARFQSLYFYCNEDAFDMMDRFRKAAGPDANLQTLARGVNVVALESQPADVVDLHAKMFKKHGMTTIRNFDALNDYHNLVDSAKSITDHKLKHQVCVTLMALPPGCEGAHDADFYEKTLRDILDSGMPYDSVCFKDASGTATPAVVHETIKRARKILPDGTYIHFHTHDTAGIAVSCNQAALEAGADAIDLSLTPCSGGTCQPDVLTMWHALRHSDYQLDVDVDKIRKLEETFQDCMKDYFLPPEATRVEPIIPWCPMPGGALTANTQMLRDNGIMDKYPEIIRAMREVVSKGGFGTSVTPVSQFYFQQAFNNVMFGPWEKISEPFGKMILGYFGKTPVPADPELVAKASEQLNLKPTTEHPIDLNNANPNLGIKATTKILKENDLKVTDENIFIVASCGAKGIAFLKGDAKTAVRKVEPKVETPPAPATPAPVVAPAAKGRYDVKVDGHSYQVEIIDGRVKVGGQYIEVELDEGRQGEGLQEAVKLMCQADGLVYQIKASPGEILKPGDTIMILESLKMEMAVKSPEHCILSELRVRVDDKVKSGQVLAVLKPL
ncbi:biotin attachment protein [Kiritimatiellaeota bacterium B1221]|nr:biotin attachment protein [Kiritimatiellaeota bacterium B1221]